MLEINIRSNDRTILIYKEICIKDSSIKYQLHYNEFLELKNNLIINNSTFINYLYEQVLIIRPVKYKKFDFYY